MSMKHLLDSKGDHCRYPEWNDNGVEHGNRLITCGKPGYPYCELHSVIVSEMRERRLLQRFGRRA